jgi:hypothetical protein
MNYLTMVRRKSLHAAERDIIIDRALLDIQSGKPKYLYEAEEVVKLPKNSVTRSRLWTHVAFSSPPATTETLTVTGERA